MNDSTGEIEGSGAEVIEGEDISKLRHVAGSIPASAFLLLAVDFCERFAFFGIISVFQNYIQNPLPPGGNGAGAPGSIDSPYPSGALNKGQRIATILQHATWLLAFTFPIPAGIIADSTWGRYKTITVSAFVYFFGMLILTLTALPYSIERGWGFIGWMVGSFFFTAGTGGVVVCLSPLTADQVKQEMIIKETRSGDRVIEDPNLTIAHIYHFFYWTGNVGSLLSIIPATQLERHVGFWAAFLLPTSIFILGLSLLVLGAKSYRKNSPRDNVILEAWGVSIIVLRSLLKDPRSYFGNSAKNDIWKSAKPSFILSQSDEGSLNANITWKDEFVDEVKRTAEVCQVFLFFPLYWISYNQMSTNLISQAATMSADGVPNDLLQSFNALVLIIFIPIVDLFVYPTLRRLGHSMNPIFRIYLGFIVVAMAMIYSAVLQYFIYHTNPCGDMVSTCSVKSHISVWVQTPTYLLVALSEILTCITGLEYTYSEAPTRMKSVVISIFLLMGGIGTILNILLSSLTQDPWLVVNYSGLAIITFVSGSVFYACFRRRGQHGVNNSMASRQEANYYEHERTPLLRNEEDICN